ncbi:uncharacterized protein [Parasteatoda tepidariorum]|uniref:uncharacterized protein n=1 Tax=Parasteatoda tepidariorum TaxID=114398 RepID=UPI001C71DF3E|nr:uncharacterized protein LOC107449045 [Parasteatoda tepidariorum]
MGPRRNMKMFKAACLYFIFLGLLAMFFLISKMPETLTLICFLTCCAGLLLEVIYGFYLIWCSLVQKANHRLHERAPLLVMSTDLEAQYNHGNSFRSTSQTLRRSSPVNIPSQTRVQHNESFIPWLPSRPCLASLPWMDSSLTSKYLDDRQKNVSHERRYTLSENVPINDLDETLRILRNHTLSESAAYDLEEV